MPLAAIKTYAKKLGKSEAEVEQYWDEAKKIVDKEYDKKSESEKYYGTAMNILKNKLKKHAGLSESRLASFLYEEQVNEEKFNGYMEADEMTLALIKLFQSGKKINDHKDFHALAEKLGLEEPAKLEEAAYAMLQSFWSQGRAMDDGMDFEVDEKEVKMGIKVEAEHTSSDIMAYRITLDHLAECADYYTRLMKMEKECEDE
jgi:hypothetical protein